MSKTEEKLICAVSYTDVCTPGNIDRSTPICYNPKEYEEGGCDMNAVELCKGLIARSGKLQKEVAAQLGTNEQSLSNKFKRGSLRADEFLAIIGILGFDIRVVSKDSGDDYEPVKRGVGKRLRMVVDGIKYDTYKADAICHSDERNETYLELYRREDGSYFVAQYVNWPGGVCGISPIGEDAATKIIEKYGD